MSIDTDGPGVGTVLAVKDERGFGAPVDIVNQPSSLEEAGSR